MFVLLSAYRFATTSGPGGIRAGPTRADAQIISGIRFLGAGVILPDGLTVRGLNTAATPWCSAAVGALARAGMYPIAVLSTAAVITANIALRPLGRRPNRPPRRRHRNHRRLPLPGRLRQQPEAHIRTLLVQAITGTDFALRTIRSYNTHRPPRHRHRRPDR